MTEQEAIELIATKLMGWTSEKVDGHWYSYWKQSNDVTRAKFNFTPFTDSNHARMVKDEILKFRTMDDDLLYDLHIENTCDGLPPLYYNHLFKRMKIDECSDGWGCNEFNLLHNAPDDVCMWSVVDILKEMEK